MSLNHTRIYVVAESKDAFLKLSLAQDPSAGERACTLAGPLFIGEDICLDEETLPMFVNIIAEELGDKGLLIADAREIPSRSQTASLSSRFSYRSM